MVKKAPTVLMRMRKTQEATELIQLTSSNILKSKVLLMGWPMFKKRTNLFLVPLLNIFHSNIKMSEMETMLTWAIIIILPKVFLCQIRQQLTMNNRLKIFKMVHMIQPKKEVIMKHLISISSRNPPPMKTTIIIKLIKVTILVAHWLIMI